MTDGYAAYQTLRDVLARERAGPIVLAHCWAHVRRKFHDAEPTWPQAAEVLELIGKLYAVEAEVAELAGDERRARLGELRRERSKPVVDEIRTWLMNQAALPRSGLGKAVGYALTLWDGLVRFVGRRAHPDRHQPGRARHATASPSVARTTTARSPSAGRASRRSSTR